MQILLLQSDPSDLILLIIIGILTFFLAVGITRWIFGIGKMLEYMKFQYLNIRMMRKTIEAIAEKQGVSKEELDAIAQECLEKTKTLSGE